ncbi:hypothetical protein FJY93_02595 [Candidatus Kaiserbacteria bacterium]|nr:hypothetical protein [Candidatus Kaiserbacteria bacterium]
MSAVPARESMWTNWKLITIVLSFLFLAAVSADVVLWYSLQKKDIAAQTLNDLIASQPPAPKTDEEKTALLDNLAAAHRAVVAQIEENSGKVQKTVVTAPDGSQVPTAVETEAKLKLLDSLRNAQ